MRHPVAVVALGALAGCAGVPAPSLGAPGPASAAVVVAGVPPGRELRLRWRDGSVVEGVLVSRDSGRAVMRIPAGDEVVVLAEVDTVWLRRPRAAAAAARGLAGGLVATAAIAGLILASHCECRDPLLWASVLPRMVLVMGGAGALVGSMSALGPAWRVAFPAPAWRRP